MTRLGVQAEEKTGPRRMVEKDFTAKRRAAVERGWVAVAGEGVVEAAVTQ